MDQMSAERKLELIEKIVFSDLQPAKRLLMVMTIFDSQFVGETIEAAEKAAIAAADADLNVCDYVIMLADAANSLNHHLLAESMADGYNGPELYAHYMLQRGRRVNG